MDEPKLPKQLPKKILRIKDLTFALPNDFQGTLQNALMLLAAYLNIEFKNGNFESNKGIKNPVSIFDDDIDDRYRVSMRYGIFEMDENGEYKLK